MIKVAARFAIALTSALTAPLFAAPADDEPCRALQPPLVLQQLNTLRAQGGACGARGSFAPAAPLVWHPLLETAARGHAAWLARDGRLAHTGADGSTPGQRVRATGYRFARVAENLAVGQADVPEVMAAWVASASHCVNLYDAAVSEAALACVPTNDGRVVWALVLGREQR